MKLLDMNVGNPCFSLNYPMSRLFDELVFKHKSAWQAPFADIGRFISLDNEKTQLFIDDFENNDIRYHAQLVHSATAKL